jgi:hypothetical protein
VTTRVERRALARVMREQAKEWPPHLVEVPRETWPERRAHMTEYPIALWRSRHYLVQVYRTDSPVDGVEARRLSVNRVTVGSGLAWEQDIPWEDLMRLKRETGHGDWYGVEIYPRDRDIVNIANMRHLWVMAEPLALGWFAAEGEQEP